MYWLHHNRVRFQMADGGAGGGGSVPRAGNRNQGNNNNSGNNNNANNGNNNNSGNNNQNADGNNNNNIGNQNNADGFDLEGDNIWSDPNDDQNRRTDNQNNGNNQTNNNPPPDPNKGLADYIAGKQYKFEISPEAVQNFVQRGDAAGFGEAINKVVQGMYKDVLMDAGKMVDGLRTRMQKEMEGIANRTVNSNSQLSTLRELVPLSRNPNVAPVAEAVFTQALKRTNGDAAKAAKIVSNYLASVRNANPKDLGLDGLPPRNSRGNNQRGSQQFDSGDDSGIDWMEFADKS